MGAPKPTPPLNREEAKKLLKGLKTFKLTPAQKGRWDSDLEAYRAMRPKGAHTSSL